MVPRYLMRLSCCCAILLLAGVPAVTYGQSPPPRPPQATLQIPANLVNQGQSHIVSSNGGTQPPFTGLNINNRVGATSFYAAGYTGSTAILANIEGGHVWNGHETLNSSGQIAQFINGPGSVGALSGTAAAYDRHATWVGQAAGGRLTPTPGEHQRGISYGATMWSGTIATAWPNPPFSTGFNFSLASYFQTYVTATRTGIGGQTADVVNSSWGFGPVSNQDISSARDPFVWIMDALAKDTSKIYVFSAGNGGGAGADTVTGPATAYNVISVGALTGDQTNPSYNTVAGFSGRGPNRAFNVPTGEYIAAARIRVDIAAPGDSLTLAFYGGTTGGNSGGTDQPGSNLYSSQNAGTSFAAPIVAAGAALLVDAGRQLSLPNSADGRVVKAILLNSADKTAGWNNAQNLESGVLVTRQALDPNVGAGRINLDRALPYYNSTNSTRDVAGTGQGDLGTVQLRGYDFGQVLETGGTTNSYRIAGSAQLAGGTLNVTLNWFINRSVDSFTAPTQVSEIAYTDIDLEVWQIVGGTFTTRFASSESQFNNTEHLYLTNLPAGEYGIRVIYFGDNWDFATQTSENYALAWDFQPIPEPTGLLALGAALLGGAAVARRRRSRTPTPI